MQKKFDIEIRKPIWLALSELYLDTELQEADFRRIARTILESPYSLEAVQEINKSEVFPVLLPNLLHIGGEWTGFEENRLMERIIQSLEKRNTWKNWWLEIEYWFFGGMLKDYWEQLAQIYLEMRQTG